MKYLLYCRKSTDTEDKQVLSLDSQETELLAHAQNLGLEVAKVLKESQSAKEPGRPVFNAVMQELQEGNADGIICWKIDRLTRNPVDGGRIQWLLQQGHIKAIHTPGRTYYPTDNVMMLSIEQAMATQYIRDLSENVKRGNRTKLEQGGWPNKAPFGYRNDKATKQLVIEPTEAKLVERTFALYTTGRYTFMQVRDKLNKEGFRTASNTEISKSLVERIIKNPFYMGVMLSGGKHYPGNHKPIITAALFNRAQVILERATRPKAQTLFFPLRGILRCASCDCQYTAALKKGHQYYYCTNGKGTCSAHAKYLRSEPATELVAEALGKIRFDPELIEIMYQAKREMYQDAYAYTEAIQKRMEGELSMLKRKQEKLFSDSSAGIIPEDFYITQMQAMQGRRVMLDMELKELKTKNKRYALEPVKEAFLEANAMQSRFLEAGPQEQKTVAAEVLWNLLVKDGEIQKARYKSFYQILANAPKMGDLESLLAD